MKDIIQRYKIKDAKLLEDLFAFLVNNASNKNYLYPGFEYGQGYKHENAIFLQLLFSGYTVYAGALRNKEIDFDAHEGKRTIYLQSTHLLSDPKTIQLYLQI